MKFALEFVAGFATCAFATLAAYYWLEAPAPTAILMGLAATWIANIAYRLAVEKLGNGTAT